MRGVAVPPTLIPLLPISQEWVLLFGHTCVGISGRLIGGCTMSVGKRKLKVVVVAFVDRLAAIVCRCGTMYVVDRCIYICNGSSVRSGVCTRPRTHAVFVVYDSRYMQFTKMCPSLALSLIIFFLKSSPRLSLLLATVKLHIADHMCSRNIYVSHQVSCRHHHHLKRVPCGRYRFLRDIWKKCM